MQAAIPPVAVQSEDTATSVCPDLPETTVHGVTFCILGLQIAGGAGVRAKATKRLAVEGWKLVERQLDPDHRLVIVDAKGRSLAEIETLRGSVNNGEYGAVQAVAWSVPIAHKNR